MSGPRTHPVGRSAQPENVGGDPSQNELNHETEEHENENETEESENIRDVDVEEPARPDLPHVLDPKLKGLLEAYNSKPHYKPGLKEANGKVAGDLQKNINKAFTNSLAQSSRLVSPTDVPLREGVAVASKAERSNLTGVYTQFGMGKGSNPDAMSISHSELLKFLEAYPDPVEGRYAILDLRTGKANHHDNVSKQLKNVLHYELDDNLVAQWGKYSWAPGNLVGLTEEKKAKSKIDKQPMWDLLMSSEPFSSLRGKEIVFFHCRQSTNRTPAIASGFLEFGRGQGSNTKVVVITGGWDNGFMGLEGSMKQRAAAFTENWKSP